MLARRALLAACAACTVPLRHPAFAATDVETKSALVGLTSNLLDTTAAPTSSPLDAIDWKAQKKRGLTTEKMAELIGAGLTERQWFVTGRGLPELFSDSFVFSDPDVSLSGFEPYCRQVRNLFEQETSRCEVTCCSVTAPNTITVQWINSGKIVLGAVKVTLKPYIVTTTLKTDPADGGLIVSQEDAFETDGFGLLLYQVPALRSLTGPPLAGVEELKKRCL